MNNIATTACKRMVLIASSTIAILLAVGCASTAPKPQFAREVVADARISSPDLAQVKVDAADGVKILPQDEERLSEKIKLRIDSRKLLNSRVTASKTYEVDLHLSRYEKGNAFARAMLVGLGYGAATSMDTIEDTFSDGVAAAVTGQADNPPKQKT